MSHVYRYSSLPVNRSQSVADHTFFVMLYSRAVAEHLIQQGISVDIGKLLQRGLVHDLDEALTGDFLRSVKYGHPRLKECLDEVSATMVGQIGDSLGFDFREDWENSKDDTIEGAILKFVDLLEVAAYIIEESRSGNRHLRRQLMECKDWMIKIVWPKELQRIVRESIDLIEKALLE